MNRLIPAALGATLLLSSTVHAEALEEEAASAFSAASWYERDVARGVTARSHQFDDLFGGPRAVHVIEINPREPGIAFSFPYLTGRSRETVTGFAGTVTNAAAGINGNFAYSGGSAQYLRVDGTLVSETLNPETADEGGVVITGDGLLRTIVRPTDGWASLPDPNIMATNIPVVTNGKRYPRMPGIPFYTADLHPRTAIGVRDDDTVVMVVVDGRAMHSRGVTYFQLAAIMIALDCEFAVGLDGGGSSAVWDAGLPGPGVANIPSDGAQRPVTNAIFASAEPLDGPVPEFDARLAPAGYHASPTRPFLVTITSGDTAEVTLPFVNTGSETWTTENVFVATSEPFDESTTLHAADDWLTPSRPDGLASGTVAAGETGSFTFTLQAPAVTSPETHVQSFTLAESGTNTPFGPHQVRIYATILPPPDSARIVVESRQPNGELTQPPEYVEYGSPRGFLNTIAKSTADDPPVLGAGARFSTSPGSTATFRPQIETTGNYDVYVTIGGGTNNNANAAYSIATSEGTITGSVHLTHEDESLVNGWKLLESDIPLEAGTAAAITFTNVDGDNATGARFVTDAVLFQLVEEVPLSGEAQD